MLEWLIFGQVIAPFWQPTELRQNIAIVMAAALAVHFFVLAPLEGLLFFGGSALLDAFVIVAICSMAYHQMGLIIIALSLASIAGNMYGFWCWHTQPLTNFYGDLFVYLNAATLLTLITGGPDAFRRSSLYSRLGGFFKPVNPLVSQYDSIPQKGEI